MKKLSDTIFMLEEIHKVVLDHYPTIGLDGVQTIYDKLFDLKKTIENISQDDFDIISDDIKKLNE